MYKGNIDQLPLTCPQLETCPATQACAPTRKLNWEPFSLWDNAQPTEPHQSMFLSLSLSLSVVKKKYGNSSSIG